MTTSEAPARHLPRARGRLERQSNSRRDRFEALALVLGMAGVLFVVVVTVQP